jgi:hypothetical protein
LQRPAGARDGADSVTPSTVALTNPHIVSNTVRRTVVACWAMLASFAAAPLPLAAWLDRARPVMPVAM